MTDTNVDVDALIADYIETRLAYDEAHQVSTDRFVDHKKAKKILAEGMIATKDDGKKKSYGLHFFLANQFSIACNKDNEDDVKDWLEQQYGDLNEFCAQKVQKTAVTDRLKDDIEGEKLNEHDVPDFMNLKTHRDVTCTGWTKFSKEKRKQE